MEWVPGDHLTFERTENYFRPEKALLDRLIFKVVPDRNTVIAQAKTGDIQIGVDYTEAQIPEMENVPGVTLVITPAQIYERYHFTMVTRDDASVPHPFSATRTCASRRARRSASISSAPASGSWSRPAASS